MIKSYDTQTVGSVMIDAIVAQRVKQEIETQRAEAAAREAAMAKKNEALKMRVEMKERRIDGLMQDKLARDYYQPERGWLIGDVWWALVGWAVLAFGALFDALGM